MRLYSDFWPLIFYYLLLSMIVTCSLLICTHLWRTGLVRLYSDFCSLISDLWPFTVYHCHMYTPHSHSPLMDRVSLSVNLYPCLILIILLITVHHCKHHHPSPAPFAKLQTQRNRRISSPENSLITPGTDFMNAMDDVVLCYVLQRARRPLFQVGHM